MALIVVNVTTAIVSIVVSVFILLIVDSTVGHHRRLYHWLILSYLGKRCRSPAAYTARLKAFFRVRADSSRTSPSVGGQYRLLAAQ